MTATTKAPRPGTQAARLLDWRRKGYDVAAMHAGTGYDYTDPNDVVMIFFPPPSIVEARIQSAVRCGARDLIAGKPRP